MAAYRQKWVPPPTLDEYMWEVQQNLWWDRRDRAKHQLLWLMDIYLGDKDGKETGLREIEGGESEAGEDDHLSDFGCHEG